MFFVTLVYYYDYIFKYFCILSMDHMMHIKWEEILSVANRGHILPSGSGRYYHCVFVRYVLALLR